ncbi:MAG: hypothetical protein QM666_03630 [Acinetobacter sp.]
MKNKIKYPIQSDWISKTFAGAFLGFGCAVLSASLIYLVSQHFFKGNIAPQLAMWSVPWIWLPVFFSCYFLPRGWHAILIMIAVNIILYTCVVYLRGY